MQFHELSSNYLITVENHNNSDDVIVEVELDKLIADDPLKLVALTKEITRRLKDEILLTPKVKLVERGTLPQSDGKAVRVIDKRPKE